MMLRRTRAAQVAPVFEDFISIFPTPELLAVASPESVAEVLRPLGLVWRLPAFPLMAKALVEKYRGVGRLSRADLLGLPGVGDYVADAVRCFGYGDPVAIVDTNSVRVAARYFGFAFGPESRRQKGVRQAIELLLDPQSPETSNLAILDLAATICKAKNPLCGECPVSGRCSWRKTQLA